MEIGDYVLVRKPENVSQYPTWVPEMDMFDGGKYKIEGIHQGERALTVTLEETYGYNFNEHWLTPVPDTLDEYTPDTGRLDMLFS